MDKLSDYQKREGLRPVAGPAGNRLPRILIHVIDILFDQKDFAARRAAEGNRFSADAEFDFFAADLTLHGNLDKEQESAARIQLSGEHAGNNRTPASGFWILTSGSCIMRLLLHHVQLDRQFFELGQGNARRRLGHDADGLLCFGEGDHVSYRLGARKDRRDSVKTEGQAAVGRCTVFERFEQEPELFPCIFFWNIQQAEHLRLDL
jgi:hypothetical protein